MWFFLEGGLTLDVGQQCVEGFDFGGREDDLGLLCGLAVTGLDELHDRQGVFFVTRARANMDATVQAERPVSGEDGVLADSTIAFNGKRPRQMGIRPLRLVAYLCPDTGKTYEFLTNIDHLPARTIADIYKSRWQVELFFKWIKQNLKLKGFVGTSKNAVLTQIWVALCLSLLLAYLKFSSGVAMSLQQIARLLQLNLFLRRDLLALLTNDRPSCRTPTAQWELAL